MITIADRPTIVTDPESQKKVDVLGRVVAVSAEVAKETLDRLEQEALSQKSKIQELKARNVCCTKIFLIIALICIIVGTILFGLRVV